MLKDLSISSFLELMAATTRNNGGDPDLWQHHTTKARALENAFQELLKENKILRDELKELQDNGGFQ